LSSLTLPRGAEAFGALFTSDATVNFLGPFAPKTPDGTNVVRPE
jgi:hypothetical protein